MTTEIALVGLAAAWIGSWYYRHVRRRKKQDEFFEIVYEVGDDIVEYRRLFLSSAEQERLESQIERIEGKVALLQGYDQTAQQEKILKKIMIEVKREMLLYKLINDLYKTISK